MAYRLRRWLWALGPVLACSVIAAVYLPPHRTRPVHTDEPLLRRVGQLRERAKELAAEWQIQEFGRRAVAYRLRLGPELTRLRAADSPTVAILLLGRDSVTRWAHDHIEPAISQTWRSLGLSVTKVAVGVILDMEPSHPAGRADSVPAVPSGIGSATYLLPDTTDRGTCVALLPAPYFARQRLTIKPEQLDWWLRSGLGPCAFYARFGVPGARVRGWLARRNYDLATAAVWDGEAGAVDQFTWLLTGQSSFQWWWEGIYSLKFSAAGCLAGRARACLADVRLGDAAQPASTRVVSPMAAWRFGRMELVGGGRWLSDVARAAGEERFREFWNTTLPVDSALSLALGEPVGEWTVRWQETIAPRPRFGPSVPMLDAGLGALTAAAALALLGLAVRRREVR